MVNVNQLRKRLGLTQQSLAHKLGVGIATVQRWDAGKIKPKRKVLIHRLEELEEELRALLRKPERGNCADCGQEVINGGEGSERMIMDRDGTPPCILCPSCHKIRHLKIRGITLYRETLAVQERRRQQSRQRDALKPTLPKAPAIKPGRRLLL